MNHNPTKIIFLIYKTADWSDAKKIDAGYSHSTIFLSKDTRFSVYAFGQKYSLDNTKDYDMSKIDADDGLPYYEQTVKIPTPLKNDTTYDTVGANIKIYWKRYNDIYFPKVYINYPTKEKELELKDKQISGDLTVKQKELSQNEKFKLKKRL